MTTRDRIKLKTENVTLKYLNSIAFLNTKLYDTFFNDHYTASIKIHLYDKKTRE